MTQDVNDDDFVPAYTGNGGNSNFEPRIYPVPKAGARRARVSLIVDIGIQNREDSYKTPDGKLCNEDTPGAIGTPQKPSPQVIVFADLVNDNVDYGGDIGKAQYRLMLNGSFAGVIKGINHAKTPPMDAKGKKIEGGVWALHPQNLLTKLAKACGREDVIESAAINRLLNHQFMAQVDVKETMSGKFDKDGNEIVYKNVNFKGASQVAAVETGEYDSNGNAIEEIPEFAPLKAKPLCITFANAKEENIQFIRPNIRKMIKLANNYAGSNMQKAMEAFEAKQAAANDDAEDAPAEKPEAKPAPLPTPKPAPNFADMDDDVPFN